MRKIILAILACTLLSACATRSVDTSYAPTPNGRDGIATGSISYAGRFSGYAVHYRNTSTGETGRFQIGESQALIPVPPKTEFEGDPKTIGMVFAVELPAGEYEVFRWNVGSGPVDTYSTVPFSIKFTVEPGKLVYVGSFQFTQLRRGGVRVTGATLTYKEATDRDLPIMRKKFPNLALTPVSSSVLKGTDLQNVGGDSEMRAMPPPVYVPIAR